jgi:hypothetical protein
VIETVDSGFTHRLWGSWPSWGLCLERREGEKGGEGERQKSGGVRGGGRREMKEERERGNEVRREEGG